jgi:hypothetical protein
MYGDSLLVV